MRILFVAFALMSLPFPALAGPRPVVFEATSADKASGFRSMAECEAALGLPAEHRGKADVGKNASRGSSFNRAAGNISRCEIIEGQPVLIVYPNDRREGAGSLSD